MNEEIEKYRSQQEAKLNQYKRIADILSRKYRLINILYIKNPLLKALAKLLPFIELYQINKELELFKLTIEIGNKQDFINIYEERIKEADEIKKEYQKSNLKKI